MAGEATDLPARLPDALKHFWEDPTGKPDLFLLGLFCRAEHRRGVVHQMELRRSGAEIDPIS